MPAARKAVVARRHVGLAAAVAVTLGFAVMEAPATLRAFEWFDVRRVEVVGTRFLPPHNAVLAAGLSNGTSVFDDTGAMRERLLRLRLVREARVRRRLPATIRVEIEEARPIAFVPTPDLRPVDRYGNVLPIRPEGQRIDLPVVAIETDVTDGGLLGDTRARALVRLVGLLQDTEPSLADRLSELRLEAGVIRLMLRDPEGAEALLPARPGTAHLAELRIALADLAARGELDRVRRIDLRYRDQAIVAFTRAM